MHEFVGNCGIFADFGEIGLLTQSYTQFAQFERISDCGFSVILNVSVYTVKSSR